MQFRENLDSFPHENPLPIAWSPMASQIHPPGFKLLTHLVHHLSFDTDPTYVIFILVTSGKHKKLTLTPFRIYPEINKRTYRGNQILVHKGNRFCVRAQRKPQMRGSITASIIQDPIVSNAVLAWDKAKDWPPQSPPYHILKRTVSGNLF